jgi:hypothetical protein
MQCSVYVGCTHTFGDVAWESVLDFLSFCWIRILTQLHLVPRLRMRAHASIPPYVFMAWDFVKHIDNSTVTTGKRLKFYSG